MSTNRYPLRTVVAVRRGGAAALLLVMVFPGHVTAEESGHKTPLAYVPGYSTWGPTNVYGVARVWAREGEVALSVHFLPRLPSPGHYASWLVDRNTGQALRVGTFNTSEAGDAVQDVILGTPISTAEETVVVTAYPTGGADDVPGPYRSAIGSLSAAAPVAAHPAPTLSSPAPTTGEHRGSGMHPTTGPGHANPHAKPSTYVVVLPRTGGGPRTPHRIVAVKRAAPVREEWEG